MFFDKDELKFYRAMFTGILRTSIFPLYLILFFLGLFVIFDGTVTFDVIVPLLLDILVFVAIFIAIFIVFGFLGIFLIKRQALFITLFNLVHFILAIQLFLTLSQWRQHPSDQSYEAIAAYQAFIVATMEYFRRRLLVPESKNNLLDVFKIRKSS